MNSKIVLIAFAAVLGLSACKDDKPACTADEAQKKVTEMMTKMQALATTNPEKLATVGQKAQELQADLADAQNDPAKACAAVDELIKAME